MNPEQTPQPVVGGPLPEPQQSFNSSQQSGSKKPLIIIIIVLALLLLAVGAYALTKKSGGSAGPLKSLVGNKTEEKATYTDAKFGFSFSYPKSWGTVTIETTTTTQEGVAGVASYNGKFSSKTPGKSLGGNDLPYMFRVNSFKFGAEESTYGDPTTAYRTVATDHYTDETHLSPGLSYCRRTDLKSEECEPFSNLGDWKEVNGVLVAKGTNNGGGGEPALFKTLGALDGDNYTMFSMYSGSASDYDALVAVAQSFKK